VRKRHHFEDPGIDGRMILKSIFNKWDSVEGLGLDWYGLG